MKALAIAKTNSSIWKFSLQFFFILLFANVCWAQYPHPSPQILPYSENFDVSLSSATTTAYPDGWRGYKLGSAAPSSTGRTGVPTADYTALTASGTANSTSSGVYNFSKKLGFLSISSADIGMVLSLNTTGKTGIKLNYDVMTIRNPYDGSANNYLEGMVLMYRTDTSSTGSFTIIPYTPEYVQSTTTQTGSTTTGQQIVSYSISLPSACDNKSVVEIRWVARTVSGTGGSRASFALDNVSAYQAGPPVLTTNAITNIASTSATAGGTISSDSGSVVFRRGIIYSTGQISDSTSTTGGGLIIDPGTGTGSFSIPITGLLSSTSYNVRAFARNAIGVTYGANQTFTTLSNLAPTPTAQPTNYSSSSTCNSMTISWSSAVGSPDGYIVLQTPGTAIPNTTPSNGSTYISGNIIGNATVKYVGPGNSFTVSSLTDNTTFTYTIYSFNGSGSLTSYLYASPLAGTTSTLSATAITALPVINIYSNGFTASWTGAANCVNDYTLNINQNIDSFENALKSFTITSTSNANAVNYFTGNSNSPVASRAYSGTYAFGVNSSRVEITSKSLNTSAFANATFSLRLGAFGNSNASGLDALDSVLVEISPDGGLTYYKRVLVTGNNNASWGYTGLTNAINNYASDNNFSTYAPSVATAGIQTDGASLITINNLPKVSNLKIKITLKNDQTTEWWVIDEANLTDRRTGLTSPSSFVFNNAVAGIPVNYSITSMAPNSSAISNVISFSTLPITLPSVASPTVSNITTNSVDINVNVLNTGSTSSISERGTIYKTSAGVTATDNALAEGNTTTGTFTQTRSLNPETHYYVKGYATNAEGTGLSSEINFFTLSNPPITQASSLSANPFSANQIDLSWVTADFPTTGATNKRYLLIRANAPNMPVFTGSNGNGPTVDANTTIVNADISYQSSFASATGLSQSTAYNFMLIPFTWNGTDSATINYLVTGAPITNATTTASTPAQLNNTSVVNITNSSAVLGANIVSDGGDGILDRGTVYSTTSPVTINNNSLSEGGTDLGAFSHIRNNLSAQTKYYFAGYAITNSASISLSSESSFFTFSNPPVFNASNLVATPVNGDQINLSWTGATFPTTGASYIGYLLIRADYPNIPSIINTNGQIPAAGPNTTIVNAAIQGLLTTATSNGLTGNSRYNYKLIPYTWDGQNPATYNYLTAGAPIADATTFAPIPTSQPFSLSFSNISCSGMTLTWRKATSLPDGYIVIRSSGATEPTTDPTPGVAYSIGNTIDNATVVYIGADTSFVAASLTNTTTYNYKIFSYNGSGTGNISYNTNTPLKGSQLTTIPAAPVAIAATGLSLTQFTANWNTQNCATNGYKLDLSLFPNFYDPNGGATTLASESFENSVSLFTASGAGALYFSGNSPATNKPPVSGVGTYPYATTGTYGYGVTNGTNVLTSNDINTSGFESASLSFRLAAFSYQSTSNGMEVSDLVKVEISPDGGNNWLNTVIVTGNSSAYWGYDASGVASTPYDGDNTAVTFTPVNAGNNLTTGYSTVNITGLPNVSQLKIRITLTNNSSNELWVIDNFTVIGKAASYVSPYNNFAVAGTSQIISGLTSNTTYYYRVRSVGNGTTSLNSNIISAIPESGFATVNTPTASSITNNSAVLGATVANTGSDVSISERGTVYKTSTGVTATDNALAEGGTSVSAFTHTRNGLSAQTKYYFKGYATNTYGTGISSESNFYTLSNPATSAVTSFVATPFSSDEINLSWSAATFPSTGATVKGYVVLSALYPNIPSLGNGNGQSPLAGLNTVVVTSSLNSTATATSAAGLNGDTRYNFIIIPYTWDGINEATYNYYTTNAPTADAKTLIPVTALPPTGLSITNVSCNGMTVSWTPGVGADGTLVLQTTGTTPPNANPVPNVIYSVGNVIGNATVAYVGSANSLTLSTLLDNTNYNFRLISFNSSGTGIGYLSGSPLNGSQSTSSVAVPVANNASNIATSSFTASWNPISCATNYLMYVYTNNMNNIAAWTFPTFGGSTYCDSSIISPGNPNYAVSNFSLSSGTQGDVSGNGTRAANTSTWTSVGKNWQVIVNTVGYTNIKLSSVQYSSASGPRDFKIQYKIGASGIWTDLSGGNITVATDYTTGVVNDLVLPTECQGIPDLYIRWATTSTTAVNLSTIGGTNTGGTSRIDNIYVKGNLVQYLTGYNGLSVNTTSANVTGLSAATQYYYHVKAVGTSTTQSSISNIVPVTTYNDIATADFRTRASGNFNDPNIWEYKYNATSYTDATSAPVSTNNITIRAVDSVNMNTDFVINSGKTVTDSGKINMNSYVISGLGSFKIVAGATMYTANTNGIYSSTTSLGSIITTSRTFDPAANYVFNGTAAQSAAGLPGTLTANTIIANAAGVTLNANKTVNSPGSIVVTSNGKLLFGSGVSTAAYSINGTGSFSAQTGATLVITSSNGIYVPGTPTVADTLGSIRVSGLRTFASNVNYEICKNDGTSKSNLGGSFGTEITSINNLTINNPKGVSLTSSNVTVNGTLSLVSGKLTTNSYKVTVGTTGSLTKSDTSWVIGNLEKNIATGATSATFEIGVDSLNYTPATIAFGNVTTAGKLMVASVSGAHPYITSSILSNSKRLNFYTKLTGTGIVFNNYSATINFNNPANLVGNANTTAFIAGNYNSGWTYPTPGTMTTTSSKADGLSDFGDLAFAEIGCTIVATASSNSPVCSGASLQLNSNTTGANGVVGYNWSGPAGYSASVQNPVINNASSLNAGVYTLTTTDALGCTSTATTTVAVNAVPVAGISNNTGVTQLTCTNPTISLTASGGSSYSWNNGLGSNANVAITSAGTYVVTATSNGCSSTESITITSDKVAPIAAIENNTGSTEINCATPSISVTATGGDSYSWNNGLGNNANATITSAGTYIVTVFGSNGCSSTASIVVTSNTTLPAASITNNSGTTELTCSVSAINVTAAGGSTYSWNNGLGTNAAAAITSAGTYIVTVYGTNGCSSTASISVTSNTTVQTAGITNNTGATELNCSRSSISVTATGGGTYSWNNGLGSNANQILTAPGVYVVTVTGTNGCTSSASVSISANTTSPIAGIDNNTNTTVLDCNTTSINLTATGNGVYSWNNGLGANANQTIISAGTYIVTVTGENGCTATASAIITSNTTSPTAGITNNTGATELNCTRSSINVTATGGNNYLWNNGLGTEANQTLTSAGTYTVTVTGANGCTSNASITVSSNTTPPTVTIINNTATTELTCTTTSISVTATGGDTYSWNNGLGNNASANITAPGTYAVLVTAANGCTADESITITSDKFAPNASIINNNGSTVLTCTNQSISVGATGGVSYSWNNGLGNNANADITSAGTYTVTVTGANGCTSTSSITITSNTVAPISAINNNTGTTIITCATPSISVTATGGVSYSWNNGLGNSDNATINSAGTYTVTVTGANGCTSTSSITVTSNTAAPSAGITNNTGTTVLTCTTTAINVTATGIGTYSWNNGLGNVAAASITSPGIYTVTVTGANGCSSTASITVTSNTTAPSALITNNTGSVQITCVTSSISVTATGGVSYSWNNGLGNNASATINAAGTYTVTVTGANGCTATDDIIITANTTAPTAAIINNSGTTVITCNTPEINLTATGNGNYLWNNGLGDNANVTVSSAGTYSVTVTGSNGCISTASITITQNVNSSTAGITNNTGSTELTCTTTSISVTATGGVSYSWNNGLGNNANANITSAGTYTVTVTGANGCISTSSITVTSNTVSPSAAIVNNTGTSVLTCTTTSINVTATGGSIYSWNNGLGTNANAVITSAGTYTVSVTGTNGCISTASINVTSNISLPVAPTAVNASRCGPGTITVGATPGVGETIDWYTAASAGTLIRSGSLTLDTSVTTASKTFYALARNTSGGCVSSTRTAVVATYNALPTAVATTVSGSSCGAAVITLSASAPTGTTLSWFADSTTTGAVLGTGTSFTTPVISSTTKYFVASQSAAGCYATTLKSATATINAVPGLPTVNTTQSRCGAGSIVLTATASLGNSAVWFRNEVGGTALTTATTTTVNYTTPATSAGDSTYYVASKATTGCFSARTAVLAQILASVNAPIAVSASRCGPGNITVGATPGVGETIDWYTAASAGTLIRSGSLTLDTSVTTASKTFYALARNISGGCVSSTRTAVVATYNALPTAVATTVSGSSCGTSSVTLSATAPTGTTLSWFADSSTTGAVLGTGTSFTTPVISSTTKYFVASQSAAGCYATTLKSATATINAVPGLPTVNTTQSRCGAGSIVLTATAPTGSAVWFRDAVTTTALTTATTATVTYTTPATSAGDSTYYVASKATTGCFSARTAVLAKINTIPAAPITTGTAICGSGRATVSASTTAASGTIDWYSATSAGTLLRSNSLTFDSLISSTKTFYALARVTTSGCVSSTRTAAIATVNPLLIAPSSLTGTTSICPIVGTANGATYTATSVTNAVSYQWTIPSGAVIDSGSNGLKIKVRFITASPNDSIFVQAVASTGCAGAKKVLKLVTTGCATPIAKTVTSSVEKMNVNVFPNPSTTNFNVQVITADKESITARILDIQGRQIKSITINPYETITIGAELKVGSYIIEVRQGKNIKTTRILKF